MNILGNRGYECNDKFIKMIGSVNIDCINNTILVKKLKENEYAIFTKIEK